jgi:hypothetical protein
MPAVKHKNGKAQAPYWVIMKQLTGDANFFGIPGDPGALIDGLKLNNISPHRREQLQRLSYIKKVDYPLDISECRCGVKFDSEGSRQSHIERRHMEPANNIKDFNECTEREREAILEGTNEYYTTQFDFHVPDPDDRRAAQEDRKLQESIDWTQTAASKK